MMRHCDGNDPNLIMYVVPAEVGDGYERVSLSTFSEYQGNAWESRVPCNCGKRFDDVRYLTIWPHRAV